MRLMLKLNYYQNKQFSIGSTAHDKGNDTQQHNYICQIVASYKSLKKLLKHLIYSGKIDINNLV